MDAIPAFMVKLQIIMDKLKATFLLWNMPDGREVSPEKQCFPFLVDFGSRYPVLCELQVCCVGRVLRQ